jgi:hypothetical protein
MQFVAANCVHATAIGRYSSALQEAIREMIAFRAIYAVVEVIAAVKGHEDGFGGLVVSMLASGSRVRGFEPDRSRWIFSDVKKSSACLPSEGK